MKVKDLKPNMIIKDCNDLLVITEIRYVEHNTYAISFYGYNEVSYLDGNTEINTM